MSDLILYVDAFWISPYAMSAWVALTEKGVPFTVKEVALHKREHDQPTFRSRTGRVPSLQQGDFWLAESSAIAEYVDELYPSPGHPRLFPADVRERAVAREVMAWVRSDLMPIREERPTSSLWYERVTKPLSGAARAAAQKLERTAGGLVREGQTTLFAEWCLADADLGLMLQRLHQNGDPLPAKLAGYAEAQWRRPSVARWNAHPRIPYVPY